jgi:TusA-related sulfurtransferase
MKILEGVESLQGLVLSGDKIHVLVDDPQKGERVIRELLESQGLEVLGLQVVRPSLEDAFVSIVQERKE